MTLHCTFRLHIPSNRFRLGLHDGARLSRSQDMHVFLSDFRQEFRYAGTKPHVLFAGRMEGDLMAGCGQNATSASGYTVKVDPALRSAAQPSPGGIIYLLEHPLSSHISLMAHEGGLQILALTGLPASSHAPGAVLVLDLAL